MDKCFASVVRTLADFLGVVGIHLAGDLKPAAFHDDTLEAQHLVHILAVHTVASPVDSYLVDILDLKFNSDVNQSKMILNAFKYSRKVETFQRNHVK